MPVMRELGEDKVIAILCADIHLSLTPPRARREEPDWLKTMEKPLDQLAELSSYYDAPILCAGDIFNHWKAEPALISFALKYLPEMYAIPGQHDLPLHNIELLEKSAFWTLCLVDRIIPVVQKEPIAVKNNIILHGFPFGKKLKPLKNLIKGKHHVALVHDYFWIKGHRFKVAKKGHALKFKRRVKGYHSIVFGDNHKGFKIKLNNVPVTNCGTMMRRRAVEKDYQPRISLLCKSGNILTHRISTRNEHFQTVEEDLKAAYKTTGGDVKDLINGLKEAQIHAGDFVEAVEYLNNKYSANKNVRKILLKALNRG